MRLQADKGPIAVRGKHPMLPRNMALHWDGSVKRWGWGQGRTILSGPMRGCVGRLESITDPAFGTGGGRWPLYRSYLVPPVRLPGVDSRAITNTDATRTPLLCFMSSQTTPSGWRRKSSLHRRKKGKGDEAHCVAVRCTCSSVGATPLFLDLVREAVGPSSFLVHVRRRCLSGEAQVGLDYSGRIPR